MIVNKQYTVLANPASYMRASKAQCLIDKQAGYKGQCQCFRPSPFPPRTCMNCCSNLSQWLGSKRARYVAHLVVGEKARVAMARWKSCMWRVVEQVVMSRSLWRVTLLNIFVWAVCVLRGEHARNPACGKLWSRL